MNSAALVWLCRLMEKPWTVGLNFPLTNVHFTVIGGREALDSYFHLKLRPACSFRRKRPSLAVRPIMSFFHFDNNLFSAHTVRKILDAYIVLLPVPVILMSGYLISLLNCHTRWLLFYRHRQNWEDKFQHTQRSDKEKVSLSISTVWLSQRKRNKYVRKLTAGENNKGYKSYT